MVLYLIAELKHMMFSSDEIVKNVWNDLQQETKLFIPKSFRSTF